MSDHPLPRRVTSTTQVQQLPQLPETIEEHHGSALDGRSSVGEEGRSLLELHDEEDQLRQVEEDLQSELSFASAYSHPRDSPNSLTCMETTL